MLKDTMSNAHLTVWTEVATIVFVALFVGVLLYLFLWRERAYWDAARRLPFEDGVRRDVEETKR